MRWRIAISPLFLVDFTIKRSADRQRSRCPIIRLWLCHLPSCRFAIAALEQIDLEWEILLGRWLRLLQRQVIGALQSVGHLAQNGQRRLIGNLNMVDADFFERRDWQLQRWAQNLLGALHLKGNRLAHQLLGRRLAAQAAGRQQPRCKEREDQR